MILRSLEIPVISQIEGFALGLGFEIALSSDFVLSSRNSRVGIPDIAFGLPLLTGIIPEIMFRYGAGAYNMVISGRVMTAAEAMGMGLIYAISEEPDIGKDTEKFARNLNRDLVAFYKGHLSQGQAIPWKSEEMFVDLYDLSKIRIKDLERFRKSLTL